MKCVCMKEVFTVGFGMGMMLSNFYLCGMMSVLRAIVYSCGRKIPKFDNVDIIS